MTLRPSRRVQLALVVLLALVTLVLAYRAVHTGGTDEPDSSAGSGPAPSTPSSSVAPPTTTLLVVGDSAAAGAGASAARASWVERVGARTGWNVVNRSAEGAGYLARKKGEGSCTRPRCPSFATLLGRSPDPSPDVVLVTGGRDDVLSAGTTDTTTRSFFAALRQLYPDATIVALDPAYDTLFAGSSALTADVRAAVRQVKGQFADIGQPLAGHAERISADGVQPDDLGHRAIARAVVARLRQLDVG